jgi:hypothetical protein
MIMKTFNENLKNNNSLYVARPLIASINYGKVFLENTIGLLPAYNFLAKFRPFGFVFDLNLPSLSAGWARNDFVSIQGGAPEYVPAFEASSKVFRCGLLALPLIPFLWIGNSLGKLLGAIVALPILAITVPFSLIKSAIENKKTEDEERQESIELFSNLLVKQYKGMEEITKTAGQAEKEDIYKDMPALAPEQEQAILSAKRLRYGSAKGEVLEALELRLKELKAESDEYERVSLVKIALNKRGATPPRETWFSYARKLLANANGDTTFLDKATQKEQTQTTGNFNKNGL